MATNSAEKNISKSTRKFIAVVIITLVIGIFVNVILHNIGTQRLESLTTSVEELANFQQAQNSTESLKNYVLGQNQAVSQLLAAFPNEDTFLKFLETMEIVTQNLDPNALITFQDPTKTTSVGLHIPFTIQMNINYNELIDFFDQIERFPYVVQILSFSMNFGESIDNSSVTINGRLYVADPFTRK